MAAERTPRPGRAVRSLRTWAEAGLSVIFPPHCPLCGNFAPERENRFICAQCWEKVSPLNPPYCRQCGLPLDVPEAFTQDQQILCGRCLTQETPFQIARAYTRYQEAVRELIHLLKFHGRDDLAAPLGKRLAVVCRRVHELRDCDAIMPVPLHRRRRRSRGYNQAELLARSLSKNTGLPVWPKILVRKRDTRSQTGLTDAQREENIRGAFAVTHPSDIAGKRLLLVDDVYTTGATLATCARVLLRQGAQQVCALTVARAVSGKPGPTLGN